MPVDEEVLGFSNLWYPVAIQNSLSVDLGDGIAIDVVAPVYSLATKFEAFSHRGKGDFFSHDLEDIIFVIENRQDAVLELLNSAQDVRVYLAAKASELMSNADFLNILPGILNSSESAGFVENTLRTIANSSAG